MRRALAVLALAAALLAPALGSAAALEPSERALIAAVNAAREERGLGPLRYEPRLARIAAGIAEASAERRGRGDPRLDVAGRLLDSGYAYLSMRAFAQSGKRDPNAQVRAWLDRRDRREPLLDRAFVEIGVGLVRAERAGGGSGGAGTDAAGGGGALHVWGVVLARPTAPADAGWGERILEHVNAFRARHGLIPLTRNPLLDEAAQAHAEDMARRDFFAHRTPDGRGPADRVDRTGYDWSRVLENLAAGQPDARAAVDGWIASDEGHREAMLDKTVREVGVGYRYLPRDGGRLSVHHYWAMTLAAPQ